MEDPAARSATAPAGGTSSSSAPRKRTWIGPALILGLFALLWAASVGTALFGPGGDRVLAGMVSDPKVLVSDLRSMSADPHVVGRALYDPERRLLVIVAKGLSPASGARRFVAWTTPRGGGRERNVGSFSPAPEAGPDLVVRDAPVAAEVGVVFVSEETDPGVGKPTPDAVRAVATFP